MMRRLYRIGFLGAFVTIVNPTFAQTDKTPRKGFMIALSAPSGTGKSTIARKLLDKDTDVVMSTSVTTRPIRTGEVEGKDYFFVTRDEFLNMDKNKELAEKSENYGNLYGISTKFIKEKVSSGKDILLDLNWDGVKQFADQKDHYDVVKVFILPPSLQELENRLRNRATDKEDVILTRLANAKNEINHHVHYDYVVVNDDADHAALQVKAIIDAERLKRTRQSIPTYE